MEREASVHNYLSRHLSANERQRGASVVKLYEVLESSKYFVMVQEFCELGSILGHMRQKPQQRLVEAEARQIFL